MHINPFYNSWWFQPIWKYSSNWITSPIFRVKINKIFQTSFKATCPSISNSSPLPTKPRIVESSYRISTLVGPSSRRSKPKRFGPGSLGGARHSSKSWGPYGGFGPHTESWDPGGPPKRPPKLRAFLFRSCRMLASSNFGGFEWKCWTTVKLEDGKT